MIRSDGRGRPLGLREKIFLYLLLFVLFTILLLWVFQTIFLDRFYTVITKRRLSDAALLMATARGTEDAEAVAEEIALDHNACVRIYMIEGNEADTYLSVDSQIGCVIHRLSQRQLNDLYEASLGNDGVWSRFQLRDGDFRFVWEMDDGSEFEGRVIDERLVYSLIVPIPGERVQFVLIDTSLEPIDGTVAVLRIQLLVLSLVLVVVSAVLAFWIARRIARPITNLNVAARRLPKGTYPADYREDGYLEVAELSETMGKAAEEIGKVDRLQRELIANISHDLRTPLTMIIGYAEVMRDIESENTPENMQVIIDEARRLSGMVGDLVELSHLQSETALGETETFSLAAEGRAVFAEYEALLAPRGYTLTAEIEGECLVTADKKRLHQVLRNLLDNAVNYAGDAKEVTLRIHEREDAVRVEVADRGDGIPEEEKENIWQRYYRAAGNHKRSVSGSGLGLSIVRENLELHGARYGVDSTLGEGSTFWFELRLQA